MNEFPIITKLGGRQVVFERLREPCSIDTPDALRMWVSRRRIPGKAVPELLRLARAAEVAIEAGDFEIRIDNGAASS